MAITVTPARFRTDFSEFGDAAVYTDAAIQFWIDIAVLTMNAARWRRLIDLGCELMVAHMLVVEKEAIDSAAAGGTPGLNVGVISSQSLGPGSIGFDVSAAVAKDASHWNKTTYGVRYRYLMNIVGMGPVTVHGSTCAGPYNGVPWFGPGNA